MPQSTNSIHKPVKANTPDDDIPPFMAVIFSWPCLLSLLTMCITQLRIVMFIGQLALFLRSSPDFKGRDDILVTLFNGCHKTGGMLKFSVKY